MNKANLFMNAGWAGLCGIVLLVAASAFDLSKAVNVAGVLIVMASCWTMLFTRNADEYTRGLWTSGASLAFATLLILFLGLPFAEGVYDGFVSSHEDSGEDETQQDIPAIASIVAAIGAFYIGLFWKRIRGGM